MKFETINDLKEAGFEGFVSMSELWSGKSPMLPRQMGVYLVVRTADEAPVFVETGTGGHFKGKNPNVSIKELQENWVDGTCVLYIGKAGGLTSSATLYKRLGQYMRFGQGEPVSKKINLLSAKSKNSRNLFRAESNLKLSKLRLKPAHQEHIVETKNGRVFSDV